MAGSTGLSKEQIMQSFAPKPIVPPLATDRFRGLGVVVDDLDKVMGDFGRFFGMSDWTVHRLSSGANMTLTVKGEERDAELLLAIGTLNDVHIELWQPVRGETLFSDFARARGGSGAHDFTVSASSRSAWEGQLKALAREGITPLQTISINDDLDLVYLDTRADLATITKVLVSKTGSVGSLAELPGGEARSLDINTNAPRFPCDKVYHFCVVVEHGRRLAVLEGYQRLIGITEWFQLDSEANVTATDCTHLGKVGNWRFKTASGRREAFCIEICEQLFGASGYSDMIDTVGEGIHHLMTAFCDKDAIAKTYETLADDEYYEVQSGVTGPIYYCYLRSDKALAGLSVEAICPETDGFVDAMTGYMGWLLFGPDRPGYRNPQVVRNSAITYEDIVPDKHEAEAAPVA